MKEGSKSKNKKERQRKKKQKGYERGNRKVMKGITGEGGGR